MLIISFILIFTLLCCVFLQISGAQAMRVFVQSLITSGIMLTALPAVVLILGKYKNINILSEGYTYWSGVYRVYSKLFIYTGISALVLGVF